jgi:type II secretory ATPase GspE/PulE/Tfp pilus assembly ATPase PilB-like protein
MANGTPTSAPFYTDPFWIGRDLHAAGKITEEQFESAQRTYRGTQGVPFADVLEQLGLITAQRAAAMLAAKFSLPLIIRIEPDRVLARSLPQIRARSRAVIPLRQVGRTLHLAVADPTAYTTSTAVGDFPQAGLSFSLHVAPRKDILSALEEVWTDEAPAENAEQFVQHLSWLAIEKRASDIHAEPKENTLNIRLRIDGKLIHHSFVSQKHRAGVLQAIKIAARLDISERRLPQGGQYKLRRGSHSYSFRVSTIPTIYGEKAVIRIADDNANLRSFAELGMDSPDIAKLEALLALPEGVIIVTGPTGAGKSTFLFSAIDRLDSHGLNIHTAEDPVEYNMPQINQTKIESPIGLDFAAVLRELMRQDPDVILVGEIRDLETAKITTQAALTGHLCFTTLHTNDAASSVTRLVDIGVEPFLVASTVKGVVALRLLRRICEACIEPHPQNDLLAERFGMPDAKFKHGRGCSHCRDTGYYGRVGIFEVFPLHEHGDSDELRTRNLVVHRIIARMGAKDNPTTEQDLLTEMLARGHRSLRADGLRKAADGITTPEEVLLNL